MLFSSDVKRNEVDEFIIMNLEFGYKTMASIEYIRGFPSALRNSFLSSSAFQFLDKHFSFSAVSRLQDFTMTSSLSISLGLSLLVFSSHLGITIAAPAAIATPASLSNLLGYNPHNVIVPEDTDAIIYGVAPGQTDDADIGAPLNFDNIDNPQPFRGSKGGIDPGPSKFLSGYGKEKANMRPGTSAYDRLNPDKLAPPVSAPDES
jgi:hypothetical protein